MPPNRYAQQSMNSGPYSQFSQQHAQVQGHGQTQQHMLPPPSLGAPANFGHGASASTSPFAIAGNSGLDRPFVGDISLAQAQGPHGAYGRGGPAQALQYESAAHHAPEDPRIRNVWKNNMMTEMANLRRLVTKYSYIAMDTEFPGIVARPVGAFNNKADYHYQTLRCNVDLLKMIQLGITLFKPDGSTPSDNEPPTVKNMTAVCTWQFNFQFDIEGDMYAHASTQMLRQAGLNFELHKRDGIDPRAFAARLIDSGLVLDHQVKWISFHSGYDFGYLMKIMLNQELPETESQFHEKLDKFFPSLFDIKYIVKYIGAKGSVNDNQDLTPEANRIIQIITQKSGLQDLANELGIQRVGAQHQAGSDSLLTGQVYFKMREKIFSGTIDEERYKGQIWGLNGQMPQTSSGPSGSGGGSSGGGAGAGIGNAPNMNGAQFYSSANGPSTPQTGHIGLAQTPAGASTLGGQSSYGSLTPGAFGNFSYAKG